jgi:hypothetical protein
LNLFVGQLTPKQKADPSVRHALDVQRAVSMGNYHAFFRLFLDSPNMGGYIIDHFSDRERIKALIVMTKVYVLVACAFYKLTHHVYRYKTLSLSFIHKELAFDNLAEARDFLMNNQCAFFTNPNCPDEEKTLDCKPIIPELARIFEEKYRKITIKGAV